MAIRLMYLLTDREGVVKKQIPVAMVCDIKDEDGMVQVRRDEDGITAWVYPSHLVAV